MDQAGGLRERMREGRTALRVIGVASGKGGVGKSNVAANLGIIAAKSGRRVLLIDADLGLANVEILLGLQPKYHLGHLLDGSLGLAQVLATGPHGVKVLPAGSGVQALTRLDDAQKLRLVSALDELEDAFDLVLVDSGAGIGDNVLFFVGASQESLLVVSPEPTSLTDAYAAVKVLANEASVRFFNVVVNQAPGDGQAREIFQKLTTVTSRFLDARLRFVGWLPKDENIHRSVMAQRPLVDLFPHSPASRALSAVADLVLNEPPPVSLDGGLKLLWNRLYKDAAVVAG